MSRHTDHNFNYVRMEPQEDSYMEEKSIITNIDQDLHLAYEYFQEKGFLCIVLNQIFNLM